MYNVIDVDFSVIKDFYKLNVDKKLFQFDKGQKLNFLSDVEDGSEVQFKYGVATINRYVKDGQVSIPNVLLESSEKITAWVKVIDENSETTTRELEISITPRQRPAEYVSEDDEQTFREYVEEQIENADWSGGSGTGANGKSAYEIAVDNGFTGTETEWLASLKGEPGKDGTDGKDGSSTTLDSTQVTSAVNAYMSEHPVTDTQKVVELNDASLWNAQKICDENAISEDTILIVNSWGCATNKILFEEEAAIQLDNTIGKYEMNYILVGPSFTEYKEVGIVPKGETHNFRVNNGYMMFLYVTVSERLLNQTLLEAYAADVTTVIKYLDKTQEDVKDLDADIELAYDMSHTNLFDLSKIRSAHFFDSREGKETIVGGGNFVSNYINIEPGANYIIVSPTNRISTVFYDNNFRYCKFGANFWNLVSTQISGVVAYSGLIPEVAYTSAGTITEFEADIEYYVYDSDTTSYVLNESEFVSDTAYYVKTTPKFVLLSTQSSYHVPEKIGLFKGTVSPNVLLPYSDANIDLSDGFKRAVKDVANENIVSELAGHNLLIFGDSQTAGYGCAVGGSYVDRIAENLQLTNFSNQSVNGSRFSNVQFSETLETAYKCITLKVESISTKLANYDDYDIILLAGGVNDMTEVLGTFEDAKTKYQAGVDTLSYEIVYDCLFRIFHSLNTNYAGRRIGVITPPRTSYADNFNGIENAMIEVAEYFAIPVYVSSKQDGISAGMKDYRGTWSSDGLHPTDAYNVVRGRKIASWIKTL